MNNAINQNDSRSRNASGRSAELHSAVSQSCTLQSVITAGALEIFHALPNGIRRYSRLKICATVFALSIGGILCVPAQQRSGPPRSTAAPKPTASLASDLDTVVDAQGQALEQAKAALAESEDPTVHGALETAIKAMEKAQTALAAAKNSPDKLGPALTAEQQAYQALLKATPREYRVSRQRNGQQGGQNSGQPNQRQLDQLDMKEEANRYETERQASAAPTQQQREQSETANRLKELAQRQQDLNERLRELQTALQAAKTEQEKEDLQRQLKRLRDEERQMLADVDQLRQKMEQSPNASANAEAREQLDQTRSDVQRAAQEMERDSPQQALAAGTRAQQAMQNLRDDLRKQTSSQFTDQMREMRNQARDLARQEDEIAKKLDSLQNGERKLDNSADTKQLSEQLTKQQSALTNLLSNMRAVSEQSENAEPLLSQKLYDTLRRADQRRTDNLLDMGAQLAQRGFLPQTSEVERAARTNINELRQGVESAAESVLGNETEALKYAQKELDDLTRQMEREVAAGRTNGTGTARSGAAGQTNRMAGANGERPGQNASNRQGTNAAGTSANGQTGDRGSQQAQNNSQRGQGQQASNREGTQQNRNQGQRAQNGQRNQNGQQGQDGQGNNPETAQSQNGQNQEQQGNSPGQQSGSSQQQGQQQAQSGQQGQGGQQQAQSGQQGQGGQQQAQSGQQGQGGQQARDGQQAQNGQQAQAGGRGGNRDRLTQLARQLNSNGGPNGGADQGGPLTGGDYVNWADRMRDVEQVLDSPDLRYQLATVRERASAIRQQYRQAGRIPDDKVVRDQLIMPMTQVRVWLQEEIARQQNANSLVPLDRDPVPDTYSELVRKYYEKLGSAQ
jgi:hypothetical protein